MRMRMSLVIVLPVCMGISGQSIASIPNYENSEALDLAREYMTDPAIRDRDTAIQYYQRYLEEYPESINQARVTAKIGLTYLYYIDAEQGYFREVEKARPYLEKAIKMDPTYVCDELLFARTNLASMEATSEARMRAGMDVYEWMMNLTRADIRDSLTREKEYQDYAWEAYPREVEGVPPGGSGDAPEEVAARYEAILNRETEKWNKGLTAFKNSEATNIIAAAKSTDSPAEALTEIMLRFKDHPVAEMAREELSKIIQGSAEEYLAALSEEDAESTLDQRTALAAPANPEPPQPAPEEEADPGIAGDTAPSPDPSNTPPVGGVSELDTNSGAHAPWLIGALVVTLVVLFAFRKPILALRSKRSAHRA